MQLFISALLTIVGLTAYSANYTTDGAIFISGGCIVIAMYFNKS